MFRKKLKTDPPPVASESDTANKRPRIGLFERPPPSGALATSKSGAFRLDACAAAIDIVVAPIETFFDDNADRTISSIEISKQVTAMLGNAKATENDLRSTIYTELKNFHGIKFPNSSLAKGTAMNLRRTKSRPLTYFEKDLKSLLNELLLNEQEKTDREIKDRLLKGLSVTATSRPDLTVVRNGRLNLLIDETNNPRDHTGETGDILFGEIKHSSSYTTQDAAKQCALYLCALLYFFRVHRGLQVQSVFGFFV
jgi:hypothetical protein